MSGIHGVIILRRLRSVMSPTRGVTYVSTQDGEPPASLYMLRWLLNIDRDAHMESKAARPAAGTSTIKAIRLLRRRGGFRIPITTGSLASSKRTVRRTVGVSASLPSCGYQPPFRPPLAGQWA